MGSQPLGVEWGKAGRVGGRVRVGSGRVRLSRSLVGSGRLRCSGPGKMESRGQVEPGRQEFVGK